MPCLFGAVRDVFKGLKYVFGVFHEAVRIVTGSLVGPSGAADYCYFWESVLAKLVCAPAFANSDTHLLGWIVFLSPSCCRCDIIDHLTRSTNFAFD